MGALLAFPAVERTTPGDQYAPKTLPANVVPLRASRAPEAPQYTPLALLLREIVSALPARAYNQVIGNLNDRRLDGDMVAQDAMKFALERLN
jgi:hypothetical protein